jgi:flagellin-like hook-associated protein FlgL
MARNPVATSAERILTLLEELRHDLLECRSDLGTIKASLDRTIQTAANADAKLAKMEGDLSFIRQRLEILPAGTFAG